MKRQELSFILKGRRELDTKVKKHGARPILLGSEQSNLDGANGTSWGNVARKTGKSD